MRRFAAIQIVVLILFIAGCSSYSGLDDGLYAEIQSDKGDILLSLEYKRVPVTVSNFVGLAEGTIAHNRGEGKPFYDGLTFHRVEDDFMIQGGCPKGVGTGNPGYIFPDEIDPGLLHSGPGILSMANSGPDSNGSQFFITHKQTEWLDGKHAVFGNVVEGMDVVNSITAGDTIKKVKIIRKGSSAEAFQVTEEGFREAVADLREKRKKARQEEAEAQLAYIEEHFGDFEQTESGLRYKILVPGDGGATPESHSTVHVYYELNLPDGRILDSNNGKEPMVRMVSDLFPGWYEGLMLMEKGEQRRFVIPPELAFGARGIPGFIPPNSYIVIETELVDFE